MKFSIIESMLRAAAQVPGNEDGEAMKREATQQLDNYIKTLTVEKPGSSVSLREGPPPLSLIDDMRD